MSSYNNNYWNNFNQQPNGQYSDNQRSNYQPGNNQQETLDPNYGRWYPQTTQATANETRAVEALNNLSHQEAPYGSAQQPGTATYPRTGWNQTRQPSANTSSTRQALPATFTSSDTTASTNQYNRYANQQSQAQPYPAGSYRQASTQSTAQQNHAQRYVSPPQQPANWNGRSASIGTLPPIQPPRGQTVTPSGVDQRALNAPAAPSSTLESSPHITVDPTQVYDPFLERQREMQKLLEERRAKEAEEAAHRTEQDRLRKEAEEKEKLAAEAARKAAASKKQAAPKATMTNSTIPATPDSLEGNIREMFQKMRQFNAMNPELLARMWEEERQSHLSADTAASNSIPVPPPAVPESAAIAEPSPAPKKAATPKSRKPRGPNKPKAPGTIVDLTAQTTTEQTKAKIASSGPAAAPAATTSAEAAASTSAPNKPATWQPGRKQVLAETAAKWLNEKKENQGKSMSAEHLAKLLDGNPSFTDLCESIEAMGFVINRGQFARTLLNAVPDLNRPAGSVANAAPVAQMTDLPSVTSVPEPPKANHNAMATTSITQPPVVPTTTNVPAETTQVQQASATPATDVKPSPMQRFQTKEQAARKRTFSDFINLADEESDTDDVPPPKVTPLDNTPYTLVEPGQDPAAVLAASGVPARPKTSARDEMKGQILVEGIQREKVARRSTYDPRTIARDILLATGRHPDMRPLNGHLMGLQFLLADHCGHVDGHKYDLATINWKVLDPGDPIESDDDARSNDGSVADDESDEATISFAQPASRSMAVSNGDGTMTMVEIPTLATTRMGLKSRGKMVGKRGRPPGRPKHEVFVNLAGGPVGAGGDNSPYIRSHGENAPEQKTAPTRSAQPSQQPSSSAPAGSPATTGSPAPGSSGAALGYAAFNQQNVKLDENGKPVKKRGRPVGWRKAIHSKEAQAAAGGAPLPPPASSKPAEPKRRGRPPKAFTTPKTDEPSFTEAQYNSWQCSWEGCSAELHNLDTLRKHVVKIHGRPLGGAFVCLWEGCSSHHTLVTSSKGKSAAADALRMRFPDITPWMNHIEASHLTPLSHALGDGPRAGLSDAYDSESSRAYLSDAATGRLITPRATPMPDIPEALAQDAAAQSSSLAPVLRRGMPRVRGTLSEAQKEDEYRLQQFEARKMILGPLWERSGVRLATERRRAMFYDDEDFEEACSADDGPQDDYDDHDDDS